MKPRENGDLILRPDNYIGEEGWERLQLLRRLGSLLRLRAERLRLL